jgi:hypothetical protein
VLDLDHYGEGQPLVEVLLDAGVSPLKQLQLVGLSTQLADNDIVDIGNPDAVLALPYIEQLPDCKGQKVVLLFVSGVDVEHIGEGGEEEAFGFIEVLPDFLLEPTLLALLVLLQQNIVQEAVGDRVVADHCGHSLEVQLA